MGISQLRGVKHNVFGRRLSDWINRQYKQIMSNNFISPHNLPLITDYLVRRENALDSHIAELTLEELGEIADAEREKSRIEREILLNPVTLGEIELDGCQPETIQNMESNSPTQFTHKVVIPFSGDKVLFTCSPIGGVRRSNNNPMIIIPLKNKIIINIGLDEYNPPLASETAKGFMKETLSLIKRNNDTVIEWNQQMIEIIAKRVDQKREHLIANRKHSSYKIEPNNSLGHLKKTI